MNVCIPMLSVSSSSEINFWILGCTALQACDNSYIK